MEDSGESDSSDRSAAGQNTNPNIGSDPMTLGKCLAIMIVVQTVLGFAMLLLALAADADSLTAMSAWAVCAVGSTIAHVFAWYPQGVEFLMLRLGGSTACRTLFPLGFAVWGIKVADPPITAVVVVVLLISYVVGLLADMYLNLARSKAGLRL